MGLRLVLLYLAIRPMTTYMVFLVFIYILVSTVILNLLFKHKDKLKLKDKLGLIGVLCVTITVFICYYLGII